MAQYTTEHGFQTQRIVKLLDTTDNTYHYILIDSEAGTRTDLGPQGLEKLIDNGRLKVDASGITLNVDSINLDQFAVTGGEGGDPGAGGKTLKDVDATLTGIADSKKLSDLAQDATLTGIADGKKLSDLAQAGETASAMNAERDAVAFADDLTAEFTALAESATVATVEISCPLANAQNMTLRIGAEGDGVEWEPGEFHAFKNIDLATIQVKGTSGDKVTINGDAVKAV